MIEVKRVQGIPVMNHCGQFYIQVGGERLGPFSSGADAQAHILRMFGSGEAKASESRKENRV